MEKCLNLETKHYNTSVLINFLFIVIAAHTEVMIPISIKSSSIRLSPVAIAAMAIEGKLSSVHRNSNNMTESYNHMLFINILCVLVIVMVGPGEELLCTVPSMTSELSAIAVSKRDIVII